MTESTKSDISEPILVPETKNKNESSDSDDDGCDDETVVKVDKHCQTVSDADNDLMCFFKNMEQTTRKFPPLLIIKVKRMISDIVYDAEEGWLAETQ